MKDEEFVIDKYYKESDYYFKFEKIEYGLIYSYNWYIYKNKGIMEYRKLKLRDTLMPNVKNFIFEEVDFSEIVNCLPKNHPDRIEFRKQRINKLLA